MIAEVVVLVALGLDTLAIAISFGLSGLSPAHRIRDALPLALAAECVECGVRVTGEELLILSRLPQVTESDRLKRLRAGHCAHGGCECDQYRLLFQNHPDLDWTKLFSAREEEKAEPSAPDYEGCRALVKRFIDPRRRAP